MRWKRASSRRPSRDAASAALVVGEQLDRLLVRAEVEQRRLLVVRPLRDAPDAAGHLLDLDSGLRSELTDQRRVERDLDPVLGPVAPARLRVADRDSHAAVLAGLDDDQVGDAGRGERPDRPLDAAPGAGLAPFGRSAPELGDRVPRRPAPASSTSDAAAQRVAPR